MDGKNIIFHIGYPKAASTTLQKNLFNTHQEISNLGIYPKDNVGKDVSYIENFHAPILNDARIRKFYHILTQEDGILYSHENIKKIWRSLLSDYGAEKTTVVFSSEQILSPRFANPEIV